MDVRRSNRHAWNIIKKLDPDKSRKNQKTALISADDISRQIKERGKHRPDHKFERDTRHEFQQISKNCPVSDPTLAAPISSGGMRAAMSTIKLGKAADVDGIYLEKIKNLGSKALSWLAAAMTDVIMTTDYPARLLHANVIAILKPGKPANDPCNYRPISLLCCFYKLLERIVLTRVTPIIEATSRVPSGKRHYRTSFGLHLVYRSRL